MLKKSDEKFITKILIFTVLGIIFAIKIDTIGQFVSHFLVLLTPLFLAVVIALFLNRPIEFFKRQFRKIPYFNNDKAKIPSIIITYLLFLGVIIGLFLIMIPQLIESFGEFISQFDSYSRSFAYTMNQFSKWVEQYNIEPKVISSLSEKGLDFIGNIVKVLPNILSSFVSKLVAILANFFLGLIISVYILSDKKRFKRQFMRIMLVIVPEKNHARFGHVFSVIQNTFSNYLYIQLTEGLILGLIFFVTTTSFGFPYALIISVFNGLSVLIPIIGAWVGAIGGGIIVLFTKPDALILYMLIVVVTQILENNIIYPRRVNDSVGLPAMWVLVVVTLGGGLLGIVGALLAVPIGSVAYQLIAEGVDRKVHKRRLLANERLQENIREDYPVNDHTAQFDGQNWIENEAKTTKKK